MRQFLLHLRKPATTSMAVLADQSREHGDSIMNGSCSTEKITTDVSSEARQRGVDEDRDMVSTDSQSYVSKSVATQGDNMPSSSSDIGATVSTKVLACKQLPCHVFARPNLDSPLGGQAADGALESKRKHSLSASEEGLPKVSLFQNGHDELICGENINNQELVHVKYSEGAHKHNDKSISKKMLVDTSRSLNSQGNVYLVGSDIGKGNSLTNIEAGSLRLALNQEQGPVDSRECSTNDVVAQASKDQSHQCLEIGGANKAMELDSDAKHSSRKRCFDSIGCLVRENLDPSSRKSKRLIVQVSTESLPATQYTRTDFFKVKGTSESLPGTQYARTDFFKVKGTFQEGSSFCSRSLDDKAEDGRADFKNGTFLMPCACDLQNYESTDTSRHMESKPLTKGRCKDCGCFMSQDVVTTSHLVAPVEQVLVEAAAQVTESPIPATQ